MGMLDTKVGGCHRGKPGYRTRHRAVLRASSIAGQVLAVDGDATVH